MLFPVMNVQPIPLDVLKVRHSEIKVMELYPENDDQAFEKFLRYSGHPDYDDTVVILRNVWANHTDNKLRRYQDIEYWKETCDLDAEFGAYYFPYRNVPSGITKPLGEILDSLDDHLEGKPLIGLSFSFEIITRNEAVYEAYRDLWQNLDSGLAERMAEVDKKAGKTALFHSFLYWGNALITPLHAALVPDYFLQVANSKRWGFVHKRYFPYLGLERQYKPGKAGTSHYFVEDYANGGVPFTEVILNPGDLMYFSSWHVHQVKNIHPDRLGFAIGARPVLSNFIKEPFRPLWFYNLNSLIPLVLVNVHQKVMSAIGMELNSRTPTPKIKACSGSLPGFNGTHQARFDFKRDANGTCRFGETDKTYQQHEMAGKLTRRTWDPQHIPGFDNIYDLSHMEQDVLRKHGIANTPFG